MAKYVYLIVPNGRQGVWIRDGLYNPICDGDVPDSEYNEGFIAHTLGSARLVRSVRELEEGKPLGEIIIKFGSKPPYVFEGVVK